MFIVLIDFPYIGNKCLCFHSNTFVINTDTKDKVKEILRQYLPKKDIEVQKALCEQKGHKEGEYFSIRLYEVPKDDMVVYIYEPSSGFNKPYETFFL